MISFGDIPVVTSTWKVDGVPTTPANLSARLMSPDGNIYPATPVATAPGVTRTEFHEANERGRWFYWIDGNGVSDDGYYDVAAAPAFAG